jgi:hypothetical protein
MAAGDITVFNEFLEDLGEEIHDFESDTIKLALIDDSVTPLQDANTPRWHASSDQDYKGNEVSAAGNYTVDGHTIPVSWEREGDTCTLNDDGGNIEWLQDAGGFGVATDDAARWGILYNSSAANKNAICFIDFGSPGLDERVGAVNIYWNSTGILTVEVV